MSLIELLKKIAIKVMKRQRNVFEVDVKKQKLFLQRLMEPRNDVERSYCQYKCHVFLKGKLVASMQNILSLVLVPIYSKVFKCNARNCSLFEREYEAVFLNEDKPKNILPNELSEKYSEIKYNADCKPTLKKNDIAFLKEIIKGGRYSSFFVFRCMCDIAQYSAIISRYSPKVIITCAEYSFTSSILTLYCNRMNIKHVDVMHGEKLYYIRDSFFRFDQCFIWDRHYYELFKKMRADTRQFVISIPESLKKSEKENITKVYDYTYYLGAENSKQLMLIREVLDKLKCVANQTVCVRPHPRYSDMDVVNKIFREIDVEDIKRITIEESICRTRGAISLYSTVLLQAYNNGISVIIDDMTSIEMFEKLKDLDYIILNKEHRLLSEIVGNMCR